jgi:phosphoribosylformylglycinamidine synthase
MRVESTDTIFTSAYTAGQTLTMPIAHGEGRYVADPAVLDRLEGEGRVIFRYVGHNPNGSTRDIAGIINEAGNVLGLMPHPERVVDTRLGSTDGLALFTSLLARVAA